MCVSSGDGRMTYEVEVETSTHNNRFYELRNKNLGALQDILRRHASCFSLELAVSGFDGAQQKSRFHWRRRGVFLDLVVFSRTPGLERLCLRMNGMLRLGMSAPFYFPLTELCLCDALLRPYDLALLLRSVGQTLQHLCLHRVRVGSSADETRCNGMDKEQSAESYCNGHAHSTSSSESTNDNFSVGFLRELRRVRRLETLRIDAPFSAACAQLGRSLHCPLASLFVDSLDLGELLREPEHTAQLTRNLFSRVIIYGGREFDAGAVRQLQLALEHQRRTLPARPPILRLVLGLPGSWSPLVQQTQVRQLAALGRVQLCQLVGASCAQAQDETVETLVRLWI